MKTKEKQKMTASELIENVKKMLNKFNEDNGVVIEHIEIGCDVKNVSNLSGKRKEVDYDFHMTFAK
jgi:predicted RNase H-related nuclease YkuK (DUF458 family)